MSEKQWVCHISGVGEKWEVEEEYGETQWKVLRTIPKPDITLGMFFHCLPKSEYRLCEPPEVWKDVTGECEIVPCGDDIMHGDGVIRQEKGYRLRKVQLETPHKCGKTLASTVCAFIVEQKVSQ